MDLLSVCYIGVAAVMHDVVMEGYNLSTTSISTLVQKCAALSSPNNTANSPQLRIAALVALSNCTYTRNTLWHNTTSLTLSLVIGAQQIIPPSGSSGSLDAYEQMSSILLKGGEDLFPVNLVEGIIDAIKNCLLQDNNPRVSLHAARCLVHIFLKHSWHSLFFFNQYLFPSREPLEGE